MTNKVRATQSELGSTYDVLLVGVGGQGVLTIGDILAEAALRHGMPVNFYPTKGMAQRGGFVKAQIRLGRDTVGPQIPEKGADLVIAMEQSEALRAVRYIKPKKDFVLYGHVWLPTAVMLGKVPYPDLELLEEHVHQAGAVFYHLDPEKRAIYEGAPVPANIYVLGAVLGQTGLGQMFDTDAVASLVRNRWKRGAERNVRAFRAGLEANGR